MKHQSKISDSEEESKMQEKRQRQREFDVEQKTEIQRAMPSKPSDSDGETA